MKLEIMLDIIFLLLSRRRVTAAEIAQKHNISRRSVYRYIDGISSVIPVYSVHGPLGGYSVTDNFRLSATFFTENEYRVILEALEAFAKELPGREIASALEKIRAVSKSSGEVNLNSSSLMIDSGPWGITSDYNNKLRVLQECVASGSLVKLWYRDVNGALTERVVEPHTVVLKQGIWYIYAFCRLRGEFRLFKVGRIEREIILNEKFTRRGIEGLRESLLYRTNDADSEEVTLEVAEEAVSEVEEWLGVACIERTEEKTYARAVMRISNGLISKILGFGGKVRVQAPASLVAAVREAAREIVRVYG